MAEYVELQERLVRCLADGGRTLSVSLEFFKRERLADKVKYVLAVMGEERCLPDFAIDKKSEKEAAELKDNGNTLFAKGLDLKALEFYTESLAKAPLKSEVMALSYANRSAALYRLGLHQECVNDIDRALAGAYPDEKRQKLLDRRANAEKRLKPPHSYHEPVPTIKNRNATIECASDAVAVAISPLVGRHVVATRTIEVGEVIAVEEPSFTLLKRDYNKHCHHCLTLCFDLIPCEECTHALFCSLKCIREATTYHKYLCRLLKTIRILDFNVIRTLPLKMVLLLKDEYSKITDYGNEEIYKSGRYREIHNLVGNVEQRSNANLFDRAITAAAFFHLVKTQVDFFENEEEEETFCELLMRNLMIMACNFHSVIELERRGRVYESNEIGAAAYAFASLFNHSCAPNVHRVNHGTALVLRANARVPKGGELFENYGEHFAQHPKSQRLAALRQQFFFDCRCEACIKNWPMYNFLPIGPTYLEFMDFYTKVEGGSLENAKEIEAQVVARLKKLGSVLNKTLCDYQELLKEIYRLYGNVNRVG